MPEPNRQVASLRSQKTNIKDLGLRPMSSRTSADYRPFLRRTFRFSVKSAFSFVILLAFCVRVWES